MPSLIWLVSFGLWSVVALAASVSVYEMWRWRSLPMPFASILGLEFSQILPYAPMTPFVFALALRFPIQRRNWVRRSFLHLGFAIVFSTLHTTFRFISPFGTWDPKLERFVSGIWSPQSHSFVIKWDVYRSLFLNNLVDDISATYLLILIVAVAFSYYRKYRDRELHSAKLTMQLAKSRLQTLKTNLQPHFLFNTLHSISALMFTDVGAADKMMARLSDLLRMSLESGDAQTTRLSREVEFATGYLEIEKIRFEDRLNVVFDIAPETLDAQVPSLFLQPLAENAVRHGIARRSAGGYIWISVTHDGSTLCVRVRDNGPGLATDSDGSGTGLGIRTTQERLQTLYGENHTFEIRPVASGGVEACVRIPLQIEPPASMQTAEDEAGFARTLSVD